MRLALRSWRRAAAFVLLLAGLTGGLAHGASPRGVAVLYPETNPPYRQIFADVLAGIEQGLAAETVRVYSLSEAPDGAALRRGLDRQSPAVAITLGRVPTETYEALGLKTPHVVGALDASPQTRPHVAGVGLAVDPALLFDTLQRLSPATRRVWVVFDPAHDRWLIDLARTAAAARELKLQPLEATDLRGAAQHFLQILETADPATDALWLVADTAVVDSETILPLLVERSWKRRLIVFSNSLQQAQSGTLFALYPDNVQLGRRLAELAARILRDADVKSSIEPLRAVKRVLNLKIAAHLELGVTQDLERHFDLVLPPW
jgi:putative ABC transport system substrate-binding protein